MLVEILISNVFNGKQLKRRKNALRFFLLIFSTVERMFLTTMTSEIESHSFYLLLLISLTAGKQEK